MTPLMRSTLIRLSFLPLLVLAGPSYSQTREVPYWASLRAEEVYMRVGPSQDFPIEWVYKRQGLPMKVVRVQEGWRLVSDPDGEQGWIVARLLTPERSALVVGNRLAPLRDSPSEDAKLNWNVEPGVVGSLGECDAGWCEFNTNGRGGWIPEDRLWGVGDP